MLKFSFAKVLHYIISVFCEPQEITNVLLNEYYYYSSLVCDVIPLLVNSHIIGVGKLIFPKNHDPILCWYLVIFITGWRLLLIIIPFKSAQPV